MLHLHCPNLAKRRRAPDVQELVGQDAWLVEDHEFPWRLGISPSEWKFKCMLQGIFKRPYFSPRWWKLPKSGSLPKIPADYHRQKCRASYFQGQVWGQEWPQPFLLRRWVPHRGVLDRKANYVVGDEEPHDLRKVCRTNLPVQLQRSFERLC